MKGRREEERGGGKVRERGREILKTAAQIQRLSRDLKTATRPSWRGREREGGREREREGGG